MGVKLQNSSCECLSARSSGLFMLLFGGNTCVLRERMCLVLGRGRRRRRMSKCHHRSERATRRRYRGPGARDRPRLARLGLFLTLGLTGIFMADRTSHVKSSAAYSIEPCCCLAWCTTDIWCNQAHQISLP